MGTNSNLKSLDEFVDEQYGIKGSVKRVAFEKGFDNFKRRFLIERAKKIGIKATLMTESEIEDIGLLNSIKQGMTKQYVDNDTFLKKLWK